MSFSPRGICPESTENRCRPRDSQASLASPIGLRVVLCLFLEKLQSCSKGRDIGGGGAGRGEDRSTGSGCIYDVTMPHGLILALTLYYASRASRREERDRTIQSLYRTTKTRRGPENQHQYLPSPRRRESACPALGPFVEIQEKRRSTDSSFSLTSLAVRRWTLSGNTRISTLAILCTLVIDSIPLDC